MHDKFYMIQNAMMQIARYSPYHDEEESRIELIGETPINVGEVVAAKLSSFGVVVEDSKGLHVLTSDNEVICIPGEPVNWRIFPRSKHYLNQLHVIYDDRLEIWSFNHD